MKVTLTIETDEKLATNDQVSQLILMVTEAIEANQELYPTSEGKIEYIATAGDCTCKWTLCNEG